jgi:hypothetical protein
VAQLERRNQKPLPLPFGASASDSCAQVSGWLIELATIQEKYVVGTLECAGSVYTLPQAQDGAPQ